MDIDQLFLQSLSTPATIISRKDGYWAIKYKQGQILALDYLALTQTRQHHNGLTIYRHSPSLVSAVLTLPDYHYVLGPVMLIDTVLSSKTSNNQKEIFLPPTLNTLAISQERFTSQVMLLSQLVNEPLSINLVKSAFQTPVTSTLFNDKLVPMTVDNEGAHVDYEYERGLKNAVEKGEPQRIHDIFSRLVASGRIGVLSSESDIRSIKNWGIICVSVTIRAAIRAGMDFDQAYTLNDQYVHQLDRLASTDEVMNTVESALKDMAQRVNLLKSAHLTTKVRQIYQQLKNTPEKYLTTQTLAREVGLSPRYLSQCFKQEIGVTPATFQKLVKLDRAISLLLTSELSIADIAASLGFSDQPHLTRCFQQYIGYPPHQVRQQHELVAEWSFNQFLTINLG